MNSTHQIQNTLFAILFGGTLGALVVSAGLGFVIAYSIEKYSNLKRAL